VIYRALEVLFLNNVKKNLEVNATSFLKEKNRKKSSAGIKWTIYFQVSIGAIM